MSYAFFPQFLLAGGELHNLCRGLQLSIRVFQPIKRQTPQCKLGRSNGDLLLGSDLICLRPLQEGFCKRKEPCQTYREVPQWVSFFCKQTWFLLFFVGTRLPLHIPWICNATATSAFYFCHECRSLCFDAELQLPWVLLVREDQKCSDQTHPCQAPVKIQLLLSWPSLLCIFGLLRLKYMDVCIDSFILHPGFK